MRSLIAPSLLAACSSLACSSGDEDDSGGGSTLGSGAVQNSGGSASSSGGSVASASGAASSGGSGASFAGGSTGGDDGLGPANTGGNGSGGVGSGGFDGGGSGGAESGGAGSSDSGGAGSGDSGGAGSGGSGGAGSGGSGGDEGSGDGGSEGDGGSSSLEEEPERLKGITAAHNMARQEALMGMPDLVWDADLAQVAQDYVETLTGDCGLVHSNGPYGENIYAIWGAQATGQDVVESWASELADYDYASNSCSGVCGHYTQVVWADSERVGCGVGDCDDGGEMWLCNYDPPGNYVGQSPY